MEILAFILSTIGTVCICTPPLFKGKNMKLILLFVFSANILIATSYLLTGAFNGAASCFVGGAQAIINFFFDKKEKKLPVWLIVIYALAFIIVNLFAFSVPTDLIAMIASLTFIMCIGQKTGTKYRVWTFINTALWLVYDVINFAWGPVLTHSILLTTVISGIVIHDIKKNAKKG